MAKNKKNKWKNWTEKDYQKEINSLRKKKTYGLVWEEDKTKEAFDYYINWEGEQTKETFGEEDNKFPVLKEVKNKAIDNKDPKYNLLIEGDNYHSLAVLNFTHNKAIDVIYIDPPYNTGNKDFKYNDHYVDFEDSYRHSKWLSFMSKRLRLARNLLKEEGVIFISIDDNEKAQLKILCDELLGEQNLVGEITIKTSSINGFKIYGNKPVRTKDYLLVYCKNYNKYSYNRVYTEKKGDWDSHFNLFYDHEKNNITDLKSILIKENILKKGEKLSSLKLEDSKFKKFYLKHKDNICQTGAYKDSPEKKESIKNKGKVIKFKSKMRNETYLYNGRMLSFLSASIKNIDGEEKEGVALALSDIWDNIDYNNIQNESPYVLPNGQKPIKLIERIIKTHPNKNLLILDFFAGSGTTGHATLSINKKDDGKRKFILCTNDEEGICSDICYPRLKSVIEGFRNKQGLDGNLKYYKHDFIDSAPTDQNKKKIVDKSTEMLCIKENAFKPIKEKEGYKIFKNTDIHLGIIFDEEEINEFIKDAKEIKGKFHVYVFSLDNSIPEKEFKTMKGKVKLCAIPEAILHVYRRIFK